MAALWPDMPRAQANDVFHSSIYRIRRALFPEALLFRDGAYQLHPEAERWVDVDEFESLLDQAERATEDEAAVLRARALELYRGDFLEQFYSDWCHARREQLREKHLAALTRLAEYHARMGQARAALGLYQTALAQDNAREEVYRALMELFANSGDRTAAIQVYRQCVQVLRDELGVPPMPETVAVYERIARLT